MIECPIKRHVNITDMESLCIMATSSRIFHTSGKNKSFKYMYLLSQTMHWELWLPLYTDLIKNLYLYYLHNGWCYITLCVDT